MYLLLFLLQIYRSDPRFLKRKVFGDKNAKGCCDDEDDKCIKCPTARRNIYLIRHAQYNQKGDDDDVNIFDYSFFSYFYLSMVNFIYVYLVSHFDKIGRRTVESVGKKACKVRD